MLAESSYTDIIRWSLLLMALLIGGMVVATRAKRRITEVDKDPAGSAGFTLSDLRAMVRSGQMSNEEFEKARTRLVAAHQASAVTTSTLRPKLATPSIEVEGPKAAESDKNDPFKAS